MACASVIDLNSNLVGLWRRNLDVLDGERLVGSPGHGSLESQSATVLSVSVAAKPGIVTLQVIV